MTCEKVRYCWNFWMRHTLVRFSERTTNEKLKSHKHCGELLREKSRAPSTKKKTPNHYNDSERCVLQYNTFNRPKSGILQGFIEYALMYIYIDMVMIYKKDEVRLSVYFINYAKSKFKINMINNNDYY